MAKIYKRSDRIPVKIDNIVIKIAPLTADQKSEIQQYFVEGRLKNDIRLASKGTELTIKYGVKEISGVTDSEGNPYKLEFEGDALTESCVDDLLNLEVVEKLVMVCVSLMKRIPESFTDEKGNKLEGVEILPNDKEASSKNVQT